MTCPGRHITIRGVTYCIVLTPSNTTPPLDGDFVTGEVRRWLEANDSGPGCFFPANTERVTLDFDEGEVSFDYPPYFLAFAPPKGKPAPEQTQYFRLPIERRPSLESTLNVSRMVEKMSATRLFDKQSSASTGRSAVDGEAAHQANMTSTDGESVLKSPSSLSTIKEKRRQIVIAPATVKASSTADVQTGEKYSSQTAAQQKLSVLKASGVKLGDSTLVVRNKYLIDALKDPSLKVTSPCDIDTAIEGLTQGQTVTIEWQEPQDDEQQEVDDLCWLRIVPQIKADDAIYYVTESGQLSYRPPSRVHEHNTITRPAVLTEEQRKELRDKLVTAGWPCRVVQGEIVVDLPNGKTMTLGQAHLRPKPLQTGVNGRLKLRRLRCGYNEFVCQPMATSPEASWVIRRYEVTFEYKSIRRRYEPFAAVLEAPWEALFSFLAEAMTVDLTNNADGRLVCCSRKDTGPEADLIKGVFVRLYDGGTRIPLKNAGDGWGEYHLPGTAAAYSRRGVYKTLLGMKDQGPDTERIKGPATMSSNAPHDMLMDARDSSETDVMDGMWFAVVPSGVPAHTTHKMSPILHSF